MSRPAAGDASAPAGAAPSTRNSTLVAAGILLSRVAGLVRELLIAGLLGPVPALDAFRAALRIPNLLQNLLGEGVLSASFIPVYSRLLAEGRREEASRVAGAVAGLLLAVAGALAVLGAFAARPLTLLIVPGYSGARLELTVDLVRILFPGVGFLVLSAWCLGVLNSHRRFFLAYVAPVLWNGAAVAGLVGGAVAGLTGAPLATALAWGTFAGGVAQFAVQVPGVRRLEPGLRPTLGTGDAATRQVLRAFVPALTGRGAVQLLAFVDLFLASYLATAAPSAIGFAQVLYLLPISLFGMSVAAAELPELASTDPGDRAAVRARLTSGLERVAFFVVPTAAVYLLLGDLVVGALYQRGDFGPLDTLQVWAVLAGYSVGLNATTSSRLLQSALYASGDTRSPALFSVARVLLAAAVGAVLMLQLDRVAVTAGGLELAGSLPAFVPVEAALRDASDNAHRLGAVGLSLAAGTSAWLEYALLRRRLGARRGELRWGGGARGPIAAGAAAAVVAGLAVRLLVGDLPPLLAAPLVLVPAGLAYLAVTAALGAREAVALARLPRRLLRR